MVKTERQLYMEKYNKEYRKTHLDYFRQYDRERYKKPERKNNIKINAKKRYEKDKEHHLNRSREWVKNNPEKALAIQKRRLNKLGNSLGIDSSKVRYSLQQWVGILFRRDGQNCQICQTQFKLEGHHIIHKREYAPLCLNSNNGIILCHSCHMASHGNTECLKKQKIPILLPDLLIVPSGNC